MKKFRMMICLVMTLGLALAFASCGSQTDTVAEEPTEETVAAAVVDLSAGITRTDNEETGEATVESDVFKVTLPNGASWDYDVEGPDRITFYNKAAREGDFGGNFFTLQTFDPDDESYDVMPNSVLGEKDGKKIVAVLVSDVEYDFNDEAATAEYMEVFDVVQKISDDPATSPLVLK